MRSELHPAPPEAKAPLRWKLPLALFLATVVSIVQAGADLDPPGHSMPLSRGLAFAIPLLAILLAHELAHYYFARRHRVPASLPMFIPMPLLSPFGTMGAIIVMRDRIRSRDALLDIGASGPIAGICLALPCFAYGLRGSTIAHVDHPFSSVWSGVSLLSWVIQRLVVGPIPEGYDVVLGPVALAGWAGMLVTMLNLLPVGQLDGGHVAYAILGPKQNRIGTRIRWSILLLAPLNILISLSPAFPSRDFAPYAHMAISSGMPWVMWFGVLTLLSRVGGGGHPPTDDSELSPLRRRIAVATLVMFVLLFMPMPWIF